MGAAMLNPVSFFPRARISGRLPAADIDHPVESRGRPGLFFGGDSRQPGEMAYLPLQVQVRDVFIELYIELRLQDAGMRIVGFRNAFESGEAPSEECVRHVQDSIAPPGIRRTEVLPFGGSRSDLESAAAVRRWGSSWGAGLWASRSPGCTATAIRSAPHTECSCSRK
ncbi:hypothetical protein GCM10020254_79470 [Streptomyces goshikiensis]